ncbi:DUF4360 domain-containing protein [Sorangium sp. So ce375]|uniref:DUF4360 domain-containing protein n=1 Tax=Sorangium sp. So ce375 TaxID=3133306 RepID=UPI003F5B4A09
MKTKPMWCLFAILILAASGLLAGCSAAPGSTASQAFADPEETSADTAPPEFRVVGISGGGSGCPSTGSFTSEVPRDGQTGAIRFSEMRLQREADGSTLQTVACTVGVNLHVPQGWMVAVSPIDLRGHVRIPAGTLVRVRSSYSFAGQPLQLAQRFALHGPRDTSYVFPEKPGEGPAVESPCGQDTILNVNTRLVLDASESRDHSASVSMDAVSYGMQLRECG